MRGTRVVGVLVSLVAAALGVSSPATASEAGPACETSVYGVTPGGRLVAWEAANFDFHDEWQWDLGALDFAPTAVVSSDWGTVFDFTATAPDGVARRVHVDVASDPPVLTSTSDEADSITPKALAYASSTPSFFYSVSTTGNLWRYDAASARGPSFRGGVQVRSGLDAVQALAFHKRVTLDGRETDVLLATTSYGRLFELLVPVDAPRRDRTIRLAASGFASYDGLVAHEGACDEDDGARGFLALDSTTGSTRWYYLGRDRVAQADDLEEGTSVPYGDWRLHPVF